MSLNKQLDAFKKEQASVAARNIAHSRPASSTPARSSTPKPAAPSDSAKRTHTEAFSRPPETSKELLTLMSYARTKLKSAHPHALPFDDVISSLSIPVDSKDVAVPRLREAFKGDKYTEWIPATATTPDMVKHKPHHPVSNAEELKDYLAKRTTALGIPVKEIKDGWSDCADGIEKLADEGFVLVTRNKRENTPKTIYPDSPALHIQVDPDFKELWLKTKVPSSETDIRNELEKAGITPTSQVKDIVKGPMKKKERKRPNRRGGKTTNQHMMGILKEYKR